MDSKEDPPYEINGKVTPVVGKIFKETLIFINACIKNNTNNPELDRRENKLSTLLALYNPLKNIIKIIEIINIQTNYNKTVKILDSGFFSRVQMTHLIGSTVALTSWVSSTRSVQPSYKVSGLHQII